MWLSSIFWLLLPSKLVFCGKYDDLVEDLLKSPVFDKRRPFHERTRNFKNESDQLSEKFKVFGEMFGKCVHEGCSEEERGAVSKALAIMSNPAKRNEMLEQRRKEEEDKERLRNEEIEKRRKEEEEKQRIRNLPSYLKLDMAYEKNVSEPLKKLLTSLELYKKDKTNVTNMKQFGDECRNVSIMATFLNEFKGWQCANTTLSASTAWTLYEVIDHVKFTSYWLSNDDKNDFNVYFAALYFHMASRDMDYGSDTIMKFVMSETSYVYDNKLYLLKKLAKHLGMNVGNATMSDCLPMTAFIQSHFNRTVLLEERNAIAHHIQSLKNVSLECANLVRSTHASEAQKITTNVEQKTAFVEPFLSEWFEPLLESTWPEVETQLVRNIVKESVYGRGPKSWVKEADEYERIAHIVHEKMKSVGNPRYLRQYVITKDHMEHHPGPHFENQCKWFTCSRGTTVEIQFVVLRSVNNESMLIDSKRDLISFTKRITPTVINAMEKKYKREKYLPYAVQRLTLEEGVNLRKFVNHSSFIGMRTNRYSKNCKVLYGLKAEGVLEPDSVQIINYHNDGGLFSNCNDWVFILGV